MVELGAELGEIAGLSSPQIQAARHEKGPMVVFAGAGSGKTRVITYRIANLLATHRVPPYRVLAVTFTNKAAAEMRHRLTKLVGEELSRDLWVGTFHATCAKLLRRYPAACGLKSSFLVYDDDDQRAVMNRIYKDQGIDDKKFPLRQVLGRIHKEKQEGVTGTDFIPGNFMERTIAQCFQAYDERLRAANAVDFDDLLLYVMRLLENKDSPEGEELRKKFSYVLVDEFQDVNRVQYRLVRGFTEKTHNLFVVGDDDQSIYRWRGADVQIVRNFRHDHPGASIVKLEQNYRSTANVVAAALGVIRVARDREPKELWTANQAGEKIPIVFCVSERDEAAYVAERIREAMEAGTPANEIAVFYRIHAQSRVLEEVLRSERLPYQIIGGMRFFERAEVKDLVAYLRLLTNPDSDVDLVRIINVPSRKIGDTTVEKLAAFARERGSSMFAAIEDFIQSEGLTAQPKKALARFLALMKDLSSSAATAAPAELAERVVEESGYRDMLSRLDSDEGEAKLQNLAELIGSIGEFEEEALAQGAVPNLEGFLERVALTAAQDELKDVPRVCLMTVHAAKGLEFDLVLLTGMEEDIFPWRSQDNERPGDVEEERRLAYVAITRAKKHLFVLHAERRMIFANTRYNQPSRFLGDIPREVMRPVISDTMRAARGRFIDRPMAPPAEPPRLAFRSPAATPASAPRVELDRAPTRGDAEPPRAATRPASGGTLELFPDVRLGGLRMVEPVGDELPVRPNFSAPAAPTRQGFVRSMQQRPGAGPERAPGERFVERDDDAGAVSGGMRPRARISADHGLGPGTRVLHKTFGTGVVLSLDGSADPAAMVQFPGWTPKLIKIRFLQPEE